MHSKELTIISVSAEVAPFSKTGGLGDVSRSLPKALHHLGHRLIVISPLYWCISPKQYKLKKIPRVFEVKIDKKKTLNFSVWEGLIEDQLPIYFIDYPAFFSRLHDIYHFQNANLRFYTFCAAALKFIATMKFRPDIIQCHDWHTGIIPYLMRKQWKKTFKDTASVFTIHNLTFQLGTAWWGIPVRLRDRGTSPLPQWKSKQWQRINFAKRAILYADAINTVSEQYAEEVLTKELGNDLHLLLRHRKNNLFGIVNGIDYHEYNPATDPGLFVHYTAHSLQLKQENKAQLQRMFHLPIKPIIPMIGIVARLTEQKGFDLLMDVFEPLMRLRFQLIVMGDGDRKYMNFFRMLQRKYPKKVGVYLQFNQKDATKVYAGSDMFLMPSRFEPCGLGQLISLRYGAIPIVRAIGGLATTITDFSVNTRKGNGFVFHSYDSRDFLVAVARALEIYKCEQMWKELTIRAMQESFSWKIPAKQYIQLFRFALKNHNTIS
ncbi:MAG TPA: glycogen/starch synthase [Patescibacteria group bacterium]|nr:glycogen/starch synthase [Patescibacteria group bacterium]